VICNLLLATGIRAGELAALHWEDIGLQAGLLQVRHTLARYNGEFVRQAPKTTQSGRCIILPTYIVALLTEHKERQSKYILSLGEESLYGGAVFTNLRGDYVNTNNLNTQLKRVVKAAGLPDIHLHSLRHTHASLLINSDITAKVIADRLGHVNTKTTLDTYSHVFAASEIKAMRAVEMKLFQGAE
jgi:integrase